MNQPNVKGKKLFHPRYISWSNRYRGKAARTQINPNKMAVIFIPIHSVPGIIEGPILIIGNHPPKKHRLVKALIMIILEYSPRKNKAKPIALYSVK